MPTMQLQKLNFGGCMSAPFRGCMSEPSHAYWRHVRGALHSFSSTHGRCDVGTATTTTHANAACTNDRLRITRNAACQEAAGVRTGMRHTPPKI